MTELVLYYILPNVVMFGGLYAVGKGIEHLSWKFILWYCAVDISSRKYYN